MQKNLNSNLKNPLHKQIYDLQSYYHHKVDKVKINKAFLPLCRVINTFDPSFIMPDFEDEEIEPLHYTHTGKQLLLFNGDIASMACALMYQNRDVKLFFIGFDSRIKALADKLHMDLYQEHKPRSIYRESPFRGIIRANLALEFAIEHGCSPVLLSGFLEGESLADHSFDNASYCREMLDAYEQAIKVECPEFHVAKPIPNLDIAWQQVVSHKKLVSSIICKSLLQERILEVAFVDFNIVPYDDSYNHNIKVIKQNYMKATGAKEASLYDIWQKYFFYNIEKSKAYKELIEAPT